MLRDPRKKHRCNCNAKELRKTHYTLGRDYWDPLTQYKHDYPPKEIPNLNNIDTNKLRKSHFIFGDDINPYQTTAMIQNKDIENAGKCNSELDEAAKNDLRRNHFVFGNYKPNFETTFRAEYYDKSKLLPKDNLDDKGKMLRAHNYEFGDDKPDYISEAAARFTKPYINPNDLNKNKFSTQLLQQSHYVFGNSNDPWNTTQKRSYTPKYSEVNPFNKDLAKSNFKFGDNDAPLKTINQTTYVEHPFQYKPVDKKLLDDLRRHHYQFGKNDLPQDLMTEYRTDYTNPNMDFNNIPKLDNVTLRKTHWNMGDGSPDLYQTTYNIVHTPKSKENQERVIPKNSLNLNGNCPMDYLTDYRDNYIKKQAEPQDKDRQNKLMNNIKNSHFNFGDMKNNFETTNANAYKYDPDKSKGANAGLGKDLINELKSTHYKLGYDGFEGITTQKKDYVPFDMEGRQPAFQEGKGFDLGDKYNNKFEGETIYQTDYVKKEIPDDGNDCWC